MIDFYWPGSTGEWLAFLDAAITVGFGLLAFAMPRATLRLLRLQPVAGVPQAAGEARASIAGFYLGLGASCILLAQPLLYLALGACWAMTALGRMAAMVFDRGNTAFNWICLPLDLILAAIPIGYALGYLV
jgi:hypothetical protein